MSQTPLQKTTTETGAPQAPFADFAPPVRPQSTLRQAITAAYRRPETEALPALIEAATLDAATRAAAAKTARKLIEALRAKHKGSGVEGLVQEYSLSSQEGVALMCLAEALLRIPDTATRDALIRDKISDGDWKSHIGGGRSLFVNAATWGLVVTGKLTATVNDRSLSAALTRLIARCGEPVIRRGVDMAMRMMGEQFVTGETIDEALRRSRALEQKGFRYSYDMLGEAATTAADAERYYRDYETAIHAIGKASAGRGIYEGPGISIKLSALHPRYARSQALRVMEELLPKVKALALIAKKYDIGLNIDAEEADRLELSLDLLEELCLDKDLAGWAGMGFVVQAYGKRCPYVLDFIIDLARRAERRVMVRLVKGAYWDAEIKRAQLDGLEDFPVYTRKIYTDVSYIACAKKLLAATDVIFPQFATHNAQSLATIYEMAGKDFKVGKYEFQCLHGMGEPLYDEVVGKGNLDRPCRIYAPVGTHETLLAYLVRRLLENGANSSFVNRIADPKVSVDELTADPVEIVRAMPIVGAPHDQIALPDNLFGETRRNSAGLDLSNEAGLTSLTAALQASAAVDWKAVPQLATGPASGETRAVVNPGDHRDVVGSVTEASEADARQAATLAAKAAASWAAVSPAERASCLVRAADLMQARMPTLLGLIAREAGKSLPNAIAEVREAIDFLRYYAEQTRRTLGPAHKALGPIVCISPWNFPLAIFTGQAAAALAAGNVVLAKPAEQTPLIAHRAVQLMHEAGIPHAALQFLPGRGEVVGAALTRDSRVKGVIFTGSTEVAQLINRTLAKRAVAENVDIPLIAETGGQNAMIVDSSSLPEQVVIDAISSAFDSAGQRCSALRVLFLQEDIAEKTIKMLKGAMQELKLGSPDRLVTDIGPVIDTEAQQNLLNHIEKVKKSAKACFSLAVPGVDQGTFVPPTVLEIGSLDELTKEVFGPVMHVIRYQRSELPKVIDQINNSGFGLTLGVHSRIDETIDYITSRAHVGNIYVNRNIVGAVVGVQPFGGEGKSGTGPKAGGPLYLKRLQKGVVSTERHARHASAAADALASWAKTTGKQRVLMQIEQYVRTTPAGELIGLPGPTGERNTLAYVPRGAIACLAGSTSVLLNQLAAVLATGNQAVVVDGASLLPNDLPAAVKGAIQSVTGVGSLKEGVQIALVDSSMTAAVRETLAARDGALVSVIDTTEEGEIPLWRLVAERALCVNTTAAGGNASLMTLEA